MHPPTNMKHLFIALLSFTLLVSAGYLTMRPATARAQEKPVRLRIGVTRDGITRITPADLQAAGVDPATVDPRTFALSSQGKPVAIYVEGEEDGRFDKGDAVLFFGRKFHGTIQDEKYTDENVYWLTAGGEPGPRIPEINAAPSFKLSSPTDFATKVHAEQNNYWFTQQREQQFSDDTWFWDILRINSKTPGITHTFPATIPFPSGKQPATLVVEEYSQSNADHRTTISLNDQLLMDEMWAGNRLDVFTVTVPATLTVNGVNTVTLGTLLQGEATVDKVFVNHWDLYYRRLFQAWQGQIDFETETEGPHEYLVKGWEQPKVVIFDITDPLAPKRLTRAATIPGKTNAILFRADDVPGNHFWLQETAALNSPASLLLRPVMTDLRRPETGADVIIITGPELETAARRLADWHEQRGYSSRVVFFSDLVDEFNDGIYHPRAITEFMRWARENWPDPKPHYLTLLGDGHWNFKGYNPEKYPAEPIIVPPYLAWVDPWQGEVPDDNIFADLDGDGNPELAVGRIPVNNEDEANAVIDKLVSYNENERVEYWQRRAVFVADHDPAVGDFAAFSDQIIDETMPDDLIIERIYRAITHPEAADVQKAITEAINRGSWMVQYAGHGSPITWMKGEGWSLKDILELENSGHYPFVSTFNCLDGYFAYPGTPGIAEFMLRQKNAGSIAAISPTGLGTTNIQYEFRSVLMNVIFNEGVHVLGDALLIAKQRFYEKHGQHYLIETMTLFGDPTLRLPTSAASQFLFTLHTPGDPNPTLYTPGTPQIYAY